MTKQLLLEEFDKITTDEEGLIASGLSLLEVRAFLSQAIDQTREETLKELIREYQDNELDGKEYDFYFSIRAKIDELSLNNLKQ